jgi:hypothetical protein
MMNMTETVWNSMRGYASGGKKKAKAARKPELPAVESEHDIKAEDVSGGD